MLDIYTVSFFGHRQLNDFIEAESRLEKLIRELLTQREYVDFLVGRNGEFDQMAASTVLRLKRVVRDDNSSLVLVLPYMTADCANNRESFENYYDRIEVCEAAASAHFKSAIQVRNRAMVDRSDMVICCIERKAGGAYQTIRYAEKQGKHIVNVADDGCGDGSLLYP
jgi:hypothetical protein